MKKVTNEWVNEFATKQRISKFEARICLTIGCLITDVEFFFRRLLKRPL